MAVQKRGLQFSTGDPAGDFHVTVGFIVVVMGSLNPLIAFFRPHKGEKGRNVWEIVHKYIFGWPTIIFGGVNCLVAAIMIQTPTYNYDPSVSSVVLIVLISGWVLLGLLSLQFVKSRGAKEATNRRFSELPEAI